jgi:hypothetical protein
MMKRCVILFVALVLILTGIPGFAAEQPVVYKDTITVTADGGEYKVGFAEIIFEKDFMDPANLPATFTVEIYAENGTAYIEFSPNTSDFNKKVHIQAVKYKGLLYDQAEDVQKNIEIKVKKQQIVVDHFSRYAFQ